MRQIICLLSIIWLKEVLCNPIQPTYPTFLNMDMYKSVSLEISSDQDGEDAILNEFMNMDKKRADIIRINSTHSFRAFDGNNYMILEKKPVEEKTCQHIDNTVDSYMFLNELRKAWDKNSKGELLYLGTQVVDGVDCHVWKFMEDESNEYVINTSIPKGNEQPQLIKFVRLRNLKRKQSKFVYNHFKFYFDYKIEDDKFKVPEDIRCE